MVNSSFLLVNIIFLYKLNKYTMADGKMARTSFEIVGTEATGT